MISKALRASSGTRYQHRSKLS